MGQLGSQDSFNSCWNCPAGLTKELSINPKHVRLVLASPAIFQHGWRPNWLVEKNGEFVTPENETEAKNSDIGMQFVTNGIQLKLVGCVNGRWEAVSGWSYEKPTGPKPVKRMVPAGSTFFFECLNEESATKLAEEFWLKPISDEENSRRDGFGHALWGTW